MGCCERLPTRLEDTKLIPAFRVGHRTVIEARAFVEDLAGRLDNRIQLSSAALAAYTETVEEAEIRAGK